MAENKLWGGRFVGDPDPSFAEFNRSFDTDRRLFEVDVRASIAHCNGLARVGVLSSSEAEEIKVALKKILQQGIVESSRLPVSKFEDVHSFVEARLVESIGDAGRKLHAGRSRNDQVATDLRIWLREAVDELSTSLRTTQCALLDFAEANVAIAIPGYTHLQRAQPVLLAHWCLAYFEMLSRDRERLSDTRKRVNVMPLGAAALAGTSYGIDRDAVAAELGFESVSANSMDAVSDRDFCIEFASACALIMMHLSRLAEDIILYATTEFGFFKLTDAVATGSSLMPQKKNPDSMELVRGKTGRIFGSLQALLTTLKGIPLSYNKDLQEDKEAVFDCFDTVAACLRVTAAVLRNIEVDSTRAAATVNEGYMNATELADYLVRKGISFRQAHETVGRIVLYALERRLELQELSIAEMQSFSALIEPDVAGVLTVGATIDSKSARGGTAPSRVLEELGRARRAIDPNL